MSFKWISRIWLWFHPNSILWVLSINFRRSLLIKCIIVFLQIHLRKIGEWMHMRIESLATLQSLWAIHFFYQKTFVDFVFNSQILHLFFFSLMLQTNSIWVTVSKTKETNCISSTGSGNPKRFIKNWLGSISQCHNVWKLLKMSSIDLSGNTVWPQTSKCRIWNIQFWHFPPIFVLLKLTCLVTSQNGPFLAFLINFRMLKMWT